MLKPPGQLIQLSIIHLQDFFNVPASGPHALQNYARQLAIPRTRFVPPAAARAATRRPCSKTLSRQTNAANASTDSRFWGLWLPTKRCLEMERLSLLPSPLSCRISALLQAAVHWYCLAFQEGDHTLSLVDSGSPPVPAGD